MASKPLYTVIAVAGIAAASGAAWWYQNKPSHSAAAAEGGPAATAPAGAASGSTRAPAVEVAKVEVMRLTDDAQAVGSLRSRQSVVVRPEVSGRVTQLNFRDGQRVKKGQVLVQLDDQLPMAQVLQARAELSIARANHKRNQDLLAQNFIAAQRVDESAANLQVAEARLALAEATAARLKIVAPFDGTAGIRTVNVGDYLKDGADVVNLEDIDAVFVDFRLPERYQTKLKVGQVATVQADALPGRRWTAVVQAIDPLVEANGRSIGIRGCIDNRQLQLRPGMFARVTAVFGERDNAAVVPEEAIVPQGNRQFVIRLVDGPDQDSKIAQRVEVKVGIRRPGRVEITEGLQPGDVVVTAGQQRVQKDGTPVRVLDLNKGGAGGSGPAGAAAAQAPRPATSGPLVPASAAVAPTGGKEAMGAKAAPAKAVGPNPCLMAVADATAPARAAGGRGRPAAAN
ncbi:efflux RND transporter periplasmic adaptor subunit [Ramlibacter humi]|uniref:Efflux RND transporter periplasmic adaptor subunit n=1 Tax=Ramlibacter humi TaxID=2530451 RepID=A0A4Z0C9R9_9BURK|nr:efflux RND transporter periplasmic adaptor subunit [Ramlibacter humi]TFZ08081.1 efflux RND transporter periplasmic adaptor subunit [Ramlibacter humi]